MFRLLPVVFVFCLTMGKAQETIGDGPRGSGTNFVKCKETFFGGSKRCFEALVTKLVVNIGSDGTNDDVSIKVRMNQQPTPIKNKNIYEIKNIEHKRRDPGHRP